MFPRTSINVEILLYSEYLIDVISSVIMATCRNLIGDPAARDFLRTGLLLPVRKQKKAKIFYFGKRLTIMNIDFTITSFQDSYIGNTMFCFGNSVYRVQHVLFWQPSHGSTCRGKPLRTDVDCLLNDTGCSTEEMKYRKKDRKLWRFDTGL